MTSSFAVSYSHTSYDQANERFYANATLTKNAGLALRGDLLLAVRRVTDQATGQDADAQLITFDGRLPVAVAGLAAGTPFLKLTDMLSVDPNNGEFYLDGAALDNILLGFDNTSPTDRFDYELILLGEANQAPRFTSNPYGGTQGQAYPMTAGGQTQLEIEVGGGNTFSYDLTGEDPDGDAVTFSVVGSLPSWLTLTADNRLTGTPTVVAGPETIQLRITDEHGFYDEAYDQTLVIEAVADAGNRAPEITNAPIGHAYVDQLYTWDANAFDPDGDSVRFTATASYTDTTGTPVTLDGASGDGFTIDANTGVLTWTPPLDALDQIVNIVVTVGDQQNPELTDSHTYDLKVVADGTPPAQVGEVDLTVANVDASGLTWDYQNLTVNGVITADITNLGPGTVHGPFDVLFFEDNDFDGQYTPGQDQVLGFAAVSQNFVANETHTLAAAITGSAAFAGAPIWAWVDSGEAIIEADEANNLSRTHEDCQVVPPVGSFDPVVQWQRTRFKQPLLHPSGILTCLLDSCRCRPE